MAESRLRSTRKTLALTPVSGMLLLLEGGYLQLTLGGPEMSIGRMSFLSVVPGGPGQLQVSSNCFHRWHSVQLPTGSGKLLGVNNAVHASAVAIIVHNIPNSCVNEILMFIYAGICNFIFALRVLLVHE